MSSLVADDPEVIGLVTQFPGYLVLFVDELHSGKESGESSAFLAAELFIEPFQHLTQQYQLGLGILRGTYQLFQSAMNLPACL